MRRALDGLSTATGWASSDGGGDPLGDGLGDGPPIGHFWVGANGAPQVAPKGKMLPKWKYWVAVFRGPPRTP